MYHHIIKKIKKTDEISITMRLRLFFFLIVLVITMIAGIIVILLVTGTFSAGISESKELINDELQDSSKHIETQYGQLSVQAVEFSEELTIKIDENLKKQNMVFSNLSDHPEQIEELITTLFENSYYSLQKSNCSGAFFILDTTVNTSIKNSRFSKSGLYVKNMEPNVLSASSPTFTILRGFSSIGRANLINLHTQWNMEFDVEDADYYHIPIDTAKKYTNLPLSKLYYWSEPFVLPGTSEEVMVCTVPLINSNQEIYGVCGFEISTMLFKLSHMPASVKYPRMFCMLSPFENKEVSINQSMFAGGYCAKDVAAENTILTVKNSKSSFSTYTSDDGYVYVGLQKILRIYPGSSPYEDQEWIVAILVPKKDIVDSITKINIILVCLLTLLVAIGILISIYFSNTYLKPISKGFEIIKSSNTAQAPKTNVQEIDDLIHYFNIYQKEMMKKVEQDKIQITRLEQFVNKTKTLTPAEYSVFNLYAKGFVAKEIADELFLSINTIKTHSKRIFAKLEIASREELLLYVTMLKEIGFEMK